MNRIFLVGAGFSKPAGLPLGKELFDLILTEAKKTTAYDYKLKPDIDRYLFYKEKIGVNDDRISENEIDFEDFLSYLDIEHFLRLKGKDTWHDEGNESQLIIRNIIGKILTEKILDFRKNIPKLYIEFAEILEPTDYLITFNYDTLIEDSLEYINKSYRLFPDRFIQVSGSSGILAQEENEVIILKMHGSIDWFDIKSFDDSFNDSKNAKYFRYPTNTIFDRDNLKIFQPSKLVDEPYFNTDIKRIYRIKNFEKYYLGPNSFLFQAPLILSPSFSKILYLNPIKEFWNGFSSAGSLNSGVSIIGFSLPKHDEYIRQPIFKLIYNFQNYDPKIIKKTKLKVIDYKNESEIEEFKDNYNFIDWENTDFFTKGFNKESLKILKI